MTTSLSSPATHPLFAVVPIEKAFAAQRAKARAEIASFAPDDLLSSDLHRLQTELLETYRIRALRLYWDARSAEPGAVAGNDGASGSRIHVFVPFSGAAGLFEMTPTQGGGEPPWGYARPNDLVLVVVAGREDARRDLERQIALITEWVALINADVDRFNRGLSLAIHTQLTSVAGEARRNAALALELGALRQPTRTTRPDDRRTSRMRPATAARPAVTPTRRGPGRPRWPNELIAAHYEEAVAATPEPKTPVAIAAHFRPFGGDPPGVSPDHLRRLLSRIATRPE